MGVIYTISRENGRHRPRISSDHSQGHVRHRPNELNPDDYTGRRGKGQSFPWLNQGEGV